MKPSVMKNGADVIIVQDVAVQCNTHYLTEATLRKPPRERSERLGRIYRYMFNIVSAIHGADLPYTVSD